MIIMFPVSRKARCRSVSKQWRETETYYISELAKLLPYPDIQKSHLHKVDILRLVKTFLYAKTLESKKTFNPVTELFQSCSK